MISSPSYSLSKNGTTHTLGNNTCLEHFSRIKKVIFLGVDMNVQCFYPYFFRYGYERFTLSSPRQCRDVQREKR